MRSHNPNISSETRENELRGSQFLASVLMNGGPIYPLVRQRSETRPFRLQSRRVGDYICLNNHDWKSRCAGVLVGKRYRRIRYVCTNCAADPKPKRGLRTDKDFNQALPRRWRNTALLQRKVHVKKSSLPCRRLAYPSQAKRAEPPSQTLTEWFFWGPMERISASRRMETHAMLFGFARSTPADVVQTKCIGRLRDQQSLSAATMSMCDVKKSQVTVLLKTRHAHCPEAVKGVSSSEAFVPTVASGVQRV